MLFKEWPTTILGKTHVGPLDLLVLQPTPFCNLDCSYCYLPNRNSTQKMSPDVLECSVKWVLDNRLVEEDKFTIVWHAGEPLVVGVDYYKEAFDIVNRVVPKHISVNHSIQTNAVLIDDKWCKFFKDNKINVGVSVDGPDFINDLYRKTRKGKGTHKQVACGIECLKSNDVPFHTISVLTAESIKYPDLLFDYLVNIGTNHCGFNIEEIEGENKESSHSNDKEKSKAAVKEFFIQMLRINNDNGNPICIRELTGAKSAISGWRKERLDYFYHHSHELIAFKIVTIDCNGNLSTFSPELIGAETEDGKDFIFGNVMENSLKEVLASKKFRDVYSAINDGIRKCRASCQYYGLCGGGSPSNKFFELGKFDGTETQFCRLHKQAPLESVLENFESQLAGV